MRLLDVIMRDNSSRDCCKVCLLLEHIKPLPTCTASEAVLITLPKVYAIQQ